MNHSTLLSALRARSTKVLLKPAVTRFATQYLCAERIVSCREALLSVLASPEFTQYLGSQSQPDKRAAALSVQKTCGRLTWFHKVEAICELMHPLYVFLRDVDGNTPGMAGKVYYRLFVLQESLAAEHPGSLLSPFTTRTRQHVRSALARRWGSMHSTIYSVGFMLDPEFADVSTFGQYSNLELMNEWHSFVDSYFPGKTAGMGTLLDFCMSVIYFHDVHIDFVCSFRDRARITALPFSPSLFRSRSPLERSKRRTFILDSAWRQLAESSTASTQDFRPTSIGIGMRAQLERVRMVARNSSEQVEAYHSDQNGQNQNARRVTG
jgi:hypothetical protein